MPRWLEFVILSPMNRTLVVRLSGAFLALSGAFTAYTYQAQPAAPLSLIKVMDNFHVIEGSGGNTSVYSTGAGVVLVDTKFDRNFQEIMTLVARATNEPIRYVINTHTHGDHVGGNPQMLALADRPQLVAHNNTRANMVRGNQAGLQQVTFGDDLELHVGDKTVVARYFGRSHTNGDIAIYFPEHRLVSTGDMGANNGPNVDFANGGSFVDWSNTINGVLEWNIDIVVPGHGPVSPRQYLVDYRNRTEDILQRVTILIREGQGRDQIAQVLQREFNLPENHAVMNRLEGIMGEILAAQ